MSFVLQVQMTKKAIAGKAQSNKRSKESSEDEPVPKKTKKNKKNRSPLKAVN